MTDTTGNTDNASQESVTPPQVPDTTQGENETSQVFTQTEVDKIVGERAKRAKETAQKQLLESLGLESLDDAQSLIEDARKRKEAEMSEVEKALAQADKEREKREALEARIAEMEAQQVANRRVSALKAALRESGATNEDDLVILIDARMKDDYLSAFDDNGTPDEKQLGAFVKQVQSKYETYFKSAGAGNPSVNNGTPPTSSDEARKQAKQTLNKKMKL